MADAYDLISGRTDEKKQLHSLNDRLEAYLDKLQSTKRGKSPSGDSNDGEQSRLQMMRERAELEIKYIHKLNEAEKKLQEQVKSVIEAKATQRKCERLKKELKIQKQENVSLHMQIFHMKNEMEKCGVTSAEFKDLEDELQRCRSMLDDSLKNYNKSMDFKVSLDHEIAKYGQLLEAVKERIADDDADDDADADDADKDAVEYADQNADEDADDAADDDIQHAVAI